MVSRTAPLICVFLMGCSHQPASFGGTAFEAEMGYDDTYSSSTGVFARNSCRATDMRESIFLSNAQLDRIGSIAERSGFFQLPSYLPVVEDENGLIVTSMPCAHYALDIFHKGQHHRVWWSCDSVRNEQHPRQVRELYSAVRGALAPYIENLPASGCHYR